MSNIEQLRRRARGFTLVELMVVVAMLAVLLAIAAPSLRDLQRSSQVTTLGNEFVMGAAFARSQAIVRNQCVTMCIAKDLTGTTPECETSGRNWNAGWIIFTNSKCDNDATASSAELLKIQMGNPSGASLSAPAADNLRSIRFDSRGITALTAKSLMSLTPSGESTATREVCLDKAGRARVVKVSAVACGTNFN